MKKFYTFRETMGEQIAPGTVAVFRAEEVSDAMTQMNDGWIAATKERDAMRALLIDLYGAGFNMLGSSGKKRQVYAHVLESKLRDIEKLVPQVTE